MRKALQTGRMEAVSALTICARARVCVCVCVCARARARACACVGACACMYTLGGERQFMAYVHILCNLWHIFTYYAIYGLCSHSMPPYSGSGGVGDPKGSARNSLVCRPTGRRRGAEPGGRGAGKFRRPGRGKSTGQNRPGRGFTPAGGAWVGAAAAHWISIIYLPIYLYIYIYNSC